MAKSNVYESQARLSVILACVAAVLILAGAILVFRNLREGMILYRSSAYLAATMGALGGAGLTGLIGFFVALNSAEQKRNSLSRLSWTGFCMNAVAMTAALSFVALFVALGQRT